MNEIEKIIIKYLTSQGDDWCWFLGSKKLTKKDTIELFKKDKKFRKQFTELVIKEVMRFFNVEPKELSK